MSISKSTPKAAEPTPDDWRNNNKTWDERLCHLHKCSYGSDITIKICEDKTEKSYKAHRFVLCMSSEVFDAMLKAPVFKNPGDGILMLVNVNAEAFEQFLEYIYCHKIQINTMKNAIGIHKIADKFNVLELKNESIKFIEQNINVNNVLEAMEFAEGQKNEPLKKQSVEIVQKNTSKVFNDGNLHTMKLEHILLILDQPALNIKEPELFRLVHKWATTCGGDECMRLKLYDCLLPKFRFKNFTGDEFVAGPVKSGMLTKQQSLAVLGHIVADENCHLPWPENFHTGTREYIAGGGSKDKTSPTKKGSKDIQDDSKQDTAKQDAAKKGDAKKDEKQPEDRSMSSEYSN